ncbi:MAG: hypothetical protein NTV21_05985 [Planctomycetota bacterium]|nr:hypothetical protein [Planctomycetota bacterium]
MNDAVPRPKFGWRERWNRAGRVFLLGLVSVWLLQTEGVVLGLELDATRHNSQVTVAELTKLQFEPFFWVLYVGLGIPVAVLHSALSLLWTPSVRIARTQAGLTLIACVAMGSAAFVDPQLAYALTIIVLVASHLVFITGPRPKPEATSAA